MSMIISRYSSKSVPYNTSFSGTDFQLEILFGSDFLEALGTFVGTFGVVWDHFWRGLETSGAGLGRLGQVWSL